MTFDVAIEDDGNRGEVQSGENFSKSGMTEVREGVAVSYITSGGFPSWKHFAVSELIRRHQVHESFVE